MDRIQAAYMRDFINEIFEELGELTEKERSDYNDGEINAYTHMLRTIKINIDEDAWGDFGLDFDIDQKYFTRSMAR